MKFQHWGLVGPWGLLANQLSLLGELQTSKKPCLKSAQGVTAEVDLMASTCIYTHAETVDVNRDSICRPNTDEAVRGTKQSCKTNLRPKSREVRAALGRAIAQGRHGLLTSAHLRAAGGYRTRPLLPVSLSSESMWW